MRDFTHEKYHFFCKNLVEHGCHLVTVRDFLLCPKSSNIIILRHDVDNKPNLALLMAKIEHRLGIKSTFYFRHNKDVFHPKIIKEICDLGHEIGYHYEVLSKMDGNFEEAIKLFRYELGNFRKICDIDTICMHGNTLSKYDNRDMWKVYNFTDFNIMGEAYLSMGSISNYFSDTGRSWNSKYKLRDLIHNKASPPTIQTTNDLLFYILNSNSKIIYVLSHPEIWADNTYDWWSMWAMNKMYNAAKLALRSMRDYGNS